jgi:hypothetical protein
MAHDHKVEDCRKKFPFITTICAEDICFENDKCDFAGAETVQDRSTVLCSQTISAFTTSICTDGVLSAAYKFIAAPMKTGEPCKMTPADRAIRHHQRRLRD